MWSRFPSSGILHRAQSMYVRCTTQSILLSYKGLIDQILSNKKALIPKDFGKNMLQSLPYIRARWASLPTSPNSPAQSQIISQSATRLDVDQSSFRGSGAQLLSSMQNSDLLPIVSQRQWRQLQQMSCRIAAFVDFHLCKSCLGTAAG